MKNQLTIIYLFLAEFYWKKKLFHKALQEYERFFVAEASCNAPNKSLYLSVKLNQSSITMLKAGQTIRCFSYANSLLSFRNTSYYFQLAVNTVLLFCSLELQKIEEAHKHIRRIEVLSESLNPSNTEPVSKLGIVNSILAVGYCAIANYRVAQDLIEKGLVIVKDTYGPNSMCYAISSAKCLCY